jgi:hypothetical protein
VRDRYKGEPNLLLWCIWDNYAVKQFPKNKHVDIPFTICTATVAGLTCVVEKALPPPVPEGDAAHNACTLFDFA